MIKGHATKHQRKIRRTRKLQFFDNLWNPYISSYLARVCAAVHLFPREIDSERLRKEASAVDD